MYNCEIIMTKYYSRTRSLGCLEFLITYKYLWFPKLSKLCTTKTVVPCSTCNTRLRLYIAACLLLPATSKGILPTNAFQASLTHSQGIRRTFE